MSNGKPFEPGNNYGHGRPKGSRNKPENKSLAMITEHEVAITSKVIADALRGDKMSKQILMRTILRQTPERFKLGPTNTPAEILKAYDDVLQAVKKQKMTPVQGQNVVSILDGKRRAVEAVELQARLEALESAMKRFLEEKSATYKKPQKDAA
jgi:hypothetical protein